MPEPAGPAVAWSAGGTTATRPYDQGGTSAAPAPGPTSLAPVDLGPVGIGTVDVGPAGTGPDDIDISIIGSKPLGRVLDVALALLGLALAAPFLVVAMIAIRLTSRGPAIFRQTRVGLHGQPFTMLKLRTMRMGGDDTAHRELCLRELLDPDATAGTSDGAFKLEDDPRVTRVGAWLRRWSLDELPQLWNVLVGDMALVGPRPALPWEAEHHSPYHRQRCLVPPGMTGLWQVSGRNRLSARQMLDLDVEYVARRSWSLDLSILIRTPAVLWRGDGAR